MRFTSFATVILAIGTALLSQAALAKVAPAEGRSPAIHDGPSKARSAMPKQRCAEQRARQGKAMPGKRAFAPEAQREGRKRDMMQKPRHRQFGGFPRSFEQDQRGQKRFRGGAMKGMPFKALRHRMRMHGKAMQRPHPFPGGEQFGRRDGRRQHRFRPIDANPHRFGAQPDGT